MPSPSGMFSSISQIQSTHCGVPTRCSPPMGSSSWRSRIWRVGKRGSSVTPGFTSTSRVTSCTSHPEHWRGSCRRQASRSSMWTRSRPRWRCSGWSSPSRTVRASPRTSRSEFLKRDPDAGGPVRGLAAIALAVLGRTDRAGIRPGRRSDRTRRKHPDGGSTCLVQSGRGRTRCSNSRSYSSVT